MGDTSMGLTLTLVATWEAVDILRFLQIEILMKLFLLVSSHPVKQKKLHLLIISISVIF